MNSSNLYLQTKNILTIIKGSKTGESVRSFLQSKGANVSQYTEVPSEEEILLNNWDIAILDDNIMEMDNRFVPFFKSNFPTVKILLLYKNIKDWQSSKVDSSYIDHFIEKPLQNNQLEKILHEIIYLPLRKKSVLIIEDARISLKKMIQIVESLGGFAYGYSDINEQEKIILTQYDIAIIDLIMKNGTTIDFIQVLKEKYPNIHIIVVSAMPHALESNMDAFSMVDFIYPKPWDEKKLEETLIDIVEQPFSERRRSIRKEGIPYFWISKYNIEMDLNEPFESPHIADLSVNGLSFHSHLDYTKGDSVIIWMLNKSSFSRHLFELRGEIKWYKTIKKSESKDINAYGVELNKNLSRDYKDYQKFIAHYTKVSRSF